MKDELNIFYDKNYIVFMNTKLLIKNSMGDNLQNAHILVRYYVAKCFLDNCNVEEAFSIYNEMQIARVEFNPQIPKYMANNEHNFKQLILNIKNNGFDSRFPIVINKKKKLVDGSHRLAIALLLGIDKVPVKIEKATEDVDNYYGPLWFKEMGLTRQSEIINQYRHLVDNLTI